MAKDPAFLFYPGDWMGGTSTFTRSHKGAYMDLLMAQHNNGHLSIQDIEIVLGSDFETMWEQKLKSKFIKDSNDLYFNKKLDEVITKRKSFSKKQKDNVKKRWNKDTKSLPNRYQTDTKKIPLENENENIDVNSIRIKREEEFILEVKVFKQYPADMLTEFIDYWTEPNKSGTKMRYEMETTWSLSRRLGRWSSNNFGKPAPAAKKVKPNTENVNRILEEDLDDPKFIRGKTKSIKDILKTKQ